MLLYAGAGIVLVLIIGFMVYFTLRSRAAKRTDSGKARYGAAGPSRPRNLGYQPPARPVSPFTKPPVPAGPGQQVVPPGPETARTPEGKTDITDSLHAMVEKYSLDAFTLATADGLVFASCGSPSATEDAADFGGARVAGSESSAGIALFSLPFLGADLTGIVRSGRVVPASILRMIEDDTQEILNRWI